CALPISGQGTSEAAPESPPADIHEIAGLDAAKGLALYGGSTRRYLAALGVFAEESRGILARLALPPSPDRSFLSVVQPPSAGDAPGAGGVLRLIQEGLAHGGGKAPGGVPAAGGDAGVRPLSMSEFTFALKSLRSGLAALGADDLSFLAMMLEKAGRAGDLRYIDSRLPAFRDELARISGQAAEAALAEGRLSPPGAPGRPQAVPGTGPADDRSRVAAAVFQAEGLGGSQVLFEELGRLDAAVGSRDLESVDSAIPRILAGSLPEGVRREAERIASLARPGEVAADPAAPPAAGSGIASRDTVEEG
ncbi:MAG: hypothetical protein LBG06_06295, partial [Deltaproteobacteria bacterium]|nr:hypothetical protein [Deltaproteobacteria bacterium]